ncbi:MAG: dihydroorotate dehydrogenase-like protein [Leptospiraceae bacterium]|nr:dihydroorotate dehydrogenase-like protein [Leptospiraceae bacterium]
MINLSTKYMGLNLRTPLVASAGPLSYHLDDIKKMEDAGISAVVLYSLFEEQIEKENQELHHHLSYGTHSFAEAITYFPEAGDFESGPEQYLEYIRKVKQSVSIPIIGSLNGYTSGGWTNFAKLIQEAGADGIELNLYNVPTDANVTGKELEEDFAETLWQVRKTVSIPIALKLSPYFSNLMNCAKKFANMGANALVLFNRFYQPDFDLEHLEVKSHVQLSTPNDLRISLRWIALLYTKVHADLAGTGGVHRAEDMLKLLMAGANVGMLCSVLIREGIKKISVIEKDMIAWMEKHEYESVTQMLGSMSAAKYHTPFEYERAQYIKALHSVHVHAEK